MRDVGVNLRSGALGLGFARQFADMRNGRPRTRGLSGQARTGHLRPEKAVVPGFRLTAVGFLILRAHGCGRSNTRDTDIRNTTRPEGSQGRERGLLVAWV